MSLEQKILAAKQRQQRRLNAAVRRSQFAVIECWKGWAPVQDHTPNLKNLIADHTTARRTRVYRWGV